MAALADDFQRDHMPVGPQTYTLADNQILYAGAMCVLDTTSGELEAGTDAAGKRFAGVYYGPQLDNTDDGLTAAVDRSQRFRVAGTGFTAADVGKNLYLLNDNTVGLKASATHDVYVGRCDAYVSATEVWCDPTCPEDLRREAQVVADPAAATSTNGVAAAAADLAALKAEAELIGDDARAALAKVAAVVDGLQALGLFVAS